MHRSPRRFASQRPVPSRCAALPAIYSTPSNTQGLTPPWGRARTARKQRLRACVNLLLTHVTGSREDMLVHSRKRSERPYRLISIALIGLVGAMPIAAQDQTQNDQTQNDQ